ncbi:unnamed protein product [Boreogadus saida]
MTAEMFDSSISISGLKLRGESQQVLFLLLSSLSVPGSPLSLLSLLRLLCDGVPVCPCVTPVHVLMLCLGKKGV